MSVDILFVFGPVGNRRFWHRRQQDPSVISLSALEALINDRFMVFSIIEKATPEITLITLRVI